MPPPLRWCLRILATFPIAIALGLTQTSSALSFKKIGADWTYVANPMMYNLEICLDNAPPGADAVIKKAAVVWGYSKFKFSFDPNNCSSSGNFPVDNSVNQIDFGDLDVATAPGVTKPFIDGVKITECDIRFNKNLNWNSSLSQPKDDQWDLFSVALHELGHCLGLGDVPENPFGDPSVPPPVMEESLKVGTARRDLTPDDKAGRADIYGN